MPLFYGTFMQKQAFKNKYVTISVTCNQTQDHNPLGVARQAMFAHFGDQFVTVYDEEQFEGQRESYGLKELVHISAVDHGHDSIEYFL